MGPSCGQSITRWHQQQFKLPETLCFSSIAKKDIIIPYSICQYCMHARTHEHKLCCADATGQLQSSNAKEQGPSCIRICRLQCHAEDNFKEMLGQPVCPCYTCCASGHVQPAQQIIAMLELTCRANCRWLCKMISCWIALFSARAAACRRSPMVSDTLSGRSPSATLQAAPNACILETICCRLAFASCKPLQQVPQMPFASAF